MNRNEPDETTLPAVDAFVERARQVVQDLDALIADLKSLVERDQQ